MGFEWICAICPHTRGKSRSSSNKRERRSPSARLHSASSPASTSPLDQTDASTPLLTSANRSGDATLTFRTREGVAETHLEVVVADVQQWQMQIQAMMQYVSKRNRLNIDEMQHIWKLRIASLQKQNRDLINTLDVLGGEKLRTEEFVDRLRKEIENRDVEIAELEDRERRQEVNHRQEMAALENRLRKLQRQNLAIKRLVQCEGEMKKGDVVKAIALTCGELEDALLTDPFRGSIKHDTEAEAGTHPSTNKGAEGTTPKCKETLSKRMETMQATAQAIESQLRNEPKRLRSSSSWRLNNSDQLPAGKTESRAASGLSMLPKAPMMDAAPIAPKTPSGIGEQNNVFQKGRMGQRAPNQTRLRTPRQSDMSSSTSPFNTFKLQPTWRP